MLFFLPLLSFKSVLSKRSPAGFSITADKITRKTPQGKWSFQLFGNHIIKTTFQPNGYHTGEQISNAVIKRPSFGTDVSVKDKEQLIDFGNVAKVLMKEMKYSYQFGEEERDVLADYFSEYEYRGFKFRLQKDEQIFGGGERALPLNRRGYGFGLYNTPAFAYGENTENLNFSVPFIISSKGYGIFFDNASRGYLDVGRKDPQVLEAGFTSGELTFYIINGKNTAEIVRHYTELVGRQPLPPRWVFGNLMSRFGYRSEQQLKAVMAKMKKEDFPVDAVILDLFWFGDSVRNTLGNLDWVNTERWPDPERMIGDLKKEGIKTILITEPYVLMGTKNYSESKRYHAVDSGGNAFTLTNFYFGFGGLLDLFRKDAQNWFWKKYKKQIAKGIAGWWGDLGEPETHPAEIHHDLKDLGFDRLFSADEVHNLYGHHWNKMLYKKYQSDYPEVRLFNLNRSGYAGSQRYSIFPWSGDVGRNWSGFRSQLPVMLGMSLSGVPYIHSDAGGFAMGEKDPELYTRWLQFASFTPVFRPHGTALEDLDTSIPNIESEPVFYPDPFKSIVRRYIQLRYDLLPYNYTLAYEQVKEGKPLTRTMFYDNGKDPELFKATDQFMWGDSILVAPVLQPGATERKLYLPEGYWYRLFSNEKVEGGRWITEEVVIDDIPLYVKAGAFIPKKAGLRNTEAYASDSLQVTYYPSSGSSSYTLYDDDGSTNSSFDKRRFELLRFEASVRKDHYTLRMSSNGGVFTGRPDHRKISLVIPGLPGRPSGITLNGKWIEVTTLTKKAPDARAAWDAVNATLHVTFTFTGAEQVIELPE